MRLLKSIAGAVAAVVLSFGAAGTANAAAALNAPAQLPLSSTAGVDDAGTVILAQARERRRLRRNRGFRRDRRFRRDRGFRRDRRLRRDRRFRRDRAFRRGIRRDRRFRRGRAFRRGPSFGVIIGGVAIAGARQRARHHAWCEARYRSYRRSSGTFQPYGGVPRRRCNSPYDGR